VDPCIAEQDAREQFDIHVYGDRVISRLADNVAATAAIAAPGDDAASDGTMLEMGFGSVVAGQEKWQVARMFASMLQLINNGNVAVDQQSAAALPGPSGSGAAALPAASKRGARKKGGKGKQPEGEEEEDVEDEKAARERPAGAAYSTLDTGVLNLRLLTSNIRELDISAARLRADEMPALPAPPVKKAAAVEVEDAEEEMEVAEKAAEEEEEDSEEEGMTLQETAEKQKPAAKKQRGRPQKAAAEAEAPAAEEKATAKRGRGRTKTAAAEVTKTVEPAAGRATRGSGRTALGAGDNKQR
jgi:hypothetical protein